MPLKVWSNTALGCNHQSICMPQLQPLCSAALVTHIWITHIRCLPRDALTIIKCGNSKRKRDASISCDVEGLVGVSGNWKEGHRYSYLYSYLFSCIHKWIYKKIWKKSLNLQSNIMYSQTSVLFLDEGFISALSLSMVCWNRWITWALSFRARSGGVEGWSWRRSQSKPWCFGVRFACAGGGEGKIELIIIIMSLTTVSSSNKNIGGVPSMQSIYLQKCSEMGYAWKRGVSTVSA